jgi:hypothetical protein
MDDDPDDLWLGGDAFNDPALREAEEIAKLPRPGPGYVICSLAWLVRVLPVAYTATHLVVAILVYSECLRQRCRTVKLSNRELRLLGISRQAKYRALIWLQGAGVLTLEETPHGQSIQVTLREFP